MKRPHRRPYAHARRQAQRRSQDRRGLLFIAVSVGVILGAVGLGLAFHSEAVSKTTGCPMSHHAPAAHTLILLDETDKLAKGEVDYARHIIMNEYFWLPIGGRLTVRNILASPDDGTDIVVCRLDDGSKILGLSKNPKKVKQDFQKIAGAKLNELLVNVATAPTQTYSPIAETVAGVMDRADFGADIKARRLVLLSDMAQHSPDFSQYGAGTPHSNLGEFHRDMSGVEMRIQYIPRHELVKLQTEAHRRFWLNYFRAMGAHVELGHSLTLGDANKETWSDVPN
jgi:hypothetical protein